MQQVETTPRTYPHTPQGHFNRMVELARQAEAAGQSPIVTFSYDDQFGERQTMHATVSFTSNPHRILLRTGSSTYYVEVTNQGQQLRLSNFRVNIIGAVNPPPMLVGPAAPALKVPTSLTVNTPKGPVEVNVPTGFTEIVADQIPEKGTQQLFVRFGPLQAAPKEMASYKIETRPGAFQEEMIRSFKLIDQPSAPFTMKDQNGKEMRVVRFEIKDSRDSQYNLGNPPQIRDPQKGLDGKLFSGYFILNKHGVVEGVNQNNRIGKGETGPGVLTGAKAPVVELNPDRAVSLRPSLQPLLMLGPGSFPAPSGPFTLATSATINPQDGAPSPKQPPFATLKFGDSKEFHLPIFPGKDGTGKTISVTPAALDIKDMPFKNARLATPEEMLQLMTPIERGTYDAIPGESDKLQKPAHLFSRSVRTPILVYEHKTATLGGTNTEPILVRYGQNKDGQKEVIAVNYRGQTFTPEEAEKLYQDYKDNPKDYPIPKGMVAMSQTNDPSTLSLQNWLGRAPTIASAFFESISPKNIGYSAVVVSPTRESAKSGPDKTTIFGIDPNTTQWSAKDPKGQKSWHSTNLINAPKALQTALSDLPFSYLQEVGPLSEETMGAIMLNAATANATSLFPSSLFFAARVPEPYDNKYQNSLALAHGNNVAQLTPQSVVTGSGNNQRTAFMFPSFYQGFERPAGMLFLDSANLPTWVNQAYRQALTAGATTNTQFNTRIPLSGQALTDIRALGGPAFNENRAPEVHAQTSPNGVISIIPMIRDGQNLVPDLQNARVFDPGYAIRVLAEWNGRVRVGNGEPPTYAPRTANAPVDPATLPTPIGILQAVREPALLPRLLLPPVVVNGTIRGAVYPPTLIPGAPPANP